MSDPRPSRREAIAALASTAALPLVRRAGVTVRRRRPQPTRPTRSRCSTRLADNLLRLVAGERHLARHRHRRASGASIPARRSLGGGTAADREPAARRTSSASTPSTRPASRMRRAPASRSCAAPMRRRSKASRSPTATSRLAAGATRRMSSSRTSAPISTSRASSTAIIGSRTPPTPRRISRGCSRTRSSSTASSGASRRRARKGLVPPAFLIDKALAQMRLSAKNAREGGTLVESIERRTKNIPGNWARARADDRGAGDRAGARAADRRAAGAAQRSPRTTPACGRGRTARSSTGGRSRPRPRRTCRRTRSTRWASASCSACTRRWTRS